MQGQRFTSSGVYMIARSVVVKLSAVLCLGILMAACSTTVPETTRHGTGPSLSGPVGEIVTPIKPLQCVGFARAQSGIDLRGDAVIWWDKAAGRYDRQQTPEPGSVIVLHGYGSGVKRAHLAVVRKLVSARMLEVDHANWLNDGRIYLKNPLIDVSPNNDWSEVRVFNLRDQSWGLRSYGVQGFIAPRPAQRLS